MMRLELEEQIQVMDSDQTPMSVMKNIIDSGVQEEAFYVMDVGQIVRQHKEWTIKLPRVEPFYAVKCNDHPIILQVLAALGTGFDCASKVEINKVLEIGVDQSRIIFANPAKPASQIRHANAVGVDLMTYDNECELHKIKAFYPSARLVLRIRCDSSVSQCPLGMKYGCDVQTEAPYLLETAAALGLSVVGISFHVGSGCQDPPVYRRAIAAAKHLFDLGMKLGFGMTLLDIGGGFPGNKGTSIDKMAELINSSLETHFPASSGVSIIAEPGRFYAASAFTLATNIHSKRECANHHTMYYINDGVYGSFNCILYDHATVTPQAYPITPKPTPNKLQQSSIWGPTCDGLDQVMDNALLPMLDIGDWLIFDDMGAYTLPVASTFNGFPIPKVHAVINEALWLLLKDLHPITEEHFTSSDSGPYWVDSWNQRESLSPVLSTFLFDQLL